MQRAESVGVRRPVSRHCMCALGVLALMLVLAPGPAAAAADTSVDLTGEWKFKGDWQEQGQAEGWHRPDFDDSAWSALQVPGSWEDQGITAVNPQWPESGPYNGYAWYRRHFTAPPGWDQEKVAFRSGQIHDKDWVYINGQLIGSTTEGEPWTRSREYAVPPGLLKAEADNVIAVRICDMGGIGGIIEFPVELVKAEAVVPPAEEAEGREYTERRTEDMIRVGGSVTVPATMRVDGDVVAVGGGADISGLVGGDVVAVGGSVYARPGSRVEGDAIAIGGQVEREGDAAIGGSVVEIPVFPSALVSRILRDTHPGLRRSMGPWWLFDRHGVLGGLGVFIWSLVFWGIVSLIALFVLRDRIELMAQALPMYPGRAAAYGVIGFVLTPGFVVAMVVAGVLVSALLAVTLIGLVLIPAVGAAVLVATAGLGALALFGAVAVWLSLGRGAAQVVNKQLASLPAVLLGLVLVWLGSRVPFVGPLVLITVSIFGFGVAIMTGLGAHPEWAHRRLGFRRARGLPSPPQAPSGSQVPPPTAEAVPPETPGDETSQAAPEGAEQGEAPAEDAGSTDQGAAPEAPPAQQD